MTFSYIGNLSSNREKVRFYIGDITEDSGVRPNSANFTDEELDGLITAEGGWQKAVAGAYEVLAAEWAQYVDTAVGPRNQEYSQVAWRYSTLAEQWRKRHGSTASAASRTFTKVDGYSDDVPANEV